MKRLNRKLWFRFLRLAKKYWTEGERGRAWTLLLLLVVLMFSYTYFMVAFNEQSGEFTSALAVYDQPRFWHSIQMFIVLLCIAVPINALYYFTRDKLGNYWRRWLTDYVITAYFRDRSYYKLLDNAKIDNPDQRIAEDVNTFTKNSINFLLVFIEAGMQLIAFSSVLWFISHELVYFLIVYTIIGSLITTFVFGRPLTGLNFLQLKKEADFRFSLIRVRENAESIAFYQGETLESGQIQSRFQEVFTNMNKLIKWQCFLNMFFYAYNYATYIVPAVILAPYVFSGNREVGVVVTAAGAFATILKALTVIIENFDALSKFAAGVNRLDAFTQAIHATSNDAAVAAEAVVTLPRYVQPRSNNPYQAPQTATKASGEEEEKSKSVIERGKSDEIVLDEVTLMTPDRQRTLVTDLSLKIEQGNHLVISGASGGGKSSLLRGIAGLWTAGSGTITTPEPGVMMFLPQHPYMMLGNLRQQLNYPRQDSTASDEDLAKLLKQVNLPDLVNRVGGFESVHDFGKMLSLGEQQRLSIARMLLAKPDYAILDEATSALDRKNEAKIYQLLTDSGVTLISVCHHPEIEQFHKQSLVLVGDGTWENEPLGAGKA
jgi:putative ATP-binding cassette transporter